MPHLQAASSEQMPPVETYNLSNAHQMLGKGGGGRDKGLGFNLTELCFGSLSSNTTSKISFSRSHATTVIE